MFCLNLERWLGWLSLSALAISLFYLVDLWDLIPGNRAVGQWARWMLGASAAALAGGFWLGRTSQRMLPLFVAVGGTALTALAQVVPSLFWLSRGALPMRAAALLLHGTVALLSLMVLVHAVRELRPLAQARHVGAFVLACALLAASPYGYFVAQNALWVVKANPPAGSTVPLHAEFRFAWPSTRHYASGGSIAYADGTPGPHAAFSAGQGFAILTPALLKPNRTLVVTIRSEAGVRTYRYRTASAPDPAVGLYRAALNRWFSPPQGGRPPGAVVLTRIPELNWEQQHAVEAGITAWAYSPLSGVPGSPSPRTGPGGREGATPLYRP